MTRRRTFVLLGLAVSAMLGVAGCTTQGAAPTPSTNVTNQISNNTVRRDQRNKVTLEKVLPLSTGIEFSTTRGLKASMLRVIKSKSQNMFSFQLADVGIGRFQLNTDIPVDTPWVSSIEIQRIRKYLLEVDCHLKKHYKAETFLMSADEFGFAFE